MPAIVINDPQFTTPYPSFSSDAEVGFCTSILAHFTFTDSSQGWLILIQAQQVLVSATQFIGDLNKCLSSQSGMYYMFERMQQLDAWTTSVITQAELLPIMPQSSDFGDHNESITAQSIRAIARIKLARYVLSLKLLISNNLPTKSAAHKSKPTASELSPTSQSLLKDIAT
jgi:hypothetical protein